jgi:hypothetical protein
MFPFNGNTMIVLADEPALASGGVGVRVLHLHQDMTVVELPAGSLHGASAADVAAGALPALDSSSPRALHVSQVITWY